MAKVIAGKPKGNYMAFVGKASCARLCDRIVELGHTSVLVVTDRALRDLGLADEAVAGLNRDGVTLTWYTKSTLILRTARRGRRAHSEGVRCDRDPRRWRFVH